jgi:hypothetical protein
MPVFCNKEIVGENGFNKETGHIGLNLKDFHEPTAERKRNRLFVAKRLTKILIPE